MESNTTGWAHLLARHVRGILQDNWMAAAAVAAGATAFAITTADHAAVVPNLLTSQTSSLAGATLEWTSGNNAGVITTVLTVATVGGVTTITTADAIPNAITAGDEFVVYRGLNDSVLAWAVNQSVSAATAILASPWTAPGNGTLEMKVYIPASGSAATATVVETANTTPGTGGASSAPGVLNAGTTLEPGNWYAFTFPVLAGYQYQIETSVAQTIIWNAYWQRGA